VHLHHIDIVGAQAAQAAFDGVAELRRRVSFGIVGAAAGLGGNDDLVTAAAERLAQQIFAVAVAGQV